MAAKKQIVIEPLNIDRYFGGKNRVALVGVELEGGWTTLPTIPKRYKFQGDGSVFGTGTIIQKHKLYAQMTQKGELPVGPMQLAAVPKVITKFHPQLVDHTCGMHIHQSFASMNQYMLLSDSPVYQETLLHYLLLWAKKEGFPDNHHIWKRLKGENEYCQKKFWPYSQMTKTNKDYSHSGDHRYTAVSYQWERYRTIEVRVLPMMETAEQAIRAINEVCHITSAYLAAVDTGRVGVKGKIELADGGVYEETLEVRV